MSVSISTYIKDNEVVRISNRVFKELIKELEELGVEFSKKELNKPYNEGIWDSKFCKYILPFMIEVEDRLVMKDVYWIDILLVIINAIEEVANNENMLFVIS